MREKKQTISHPFFPNKFEVFDNFLRIPGLGTINGVIFCKTFSSANKKFALKFLPEIDYILSGWNSQTHVDETFEIVHVDFRFLPMIDYSLSCPGYNVSRILCQQKLRLFVS